MDINKKVWDLWTQLFTRDKGGVLLQLILDLLFRERLNKMYYFEINKRNFQNLTTVSDVLVTRVLFEGKKAVGIELIQNKTIKKYRAGPEFCFMIISLNLFYRGNNSQWWINKFSPATDVVRSWRL